jgi:hypothetical protein
VDVAEARMVDAEIGIVDRAAEPEYRVFLEEARLELRDFSNVEDGRRGSARLTGQFMGSGPTTLEATFAPAARQADFSFDLSMRDVDLAAMNDALRATGGVDVTRGTFSLYTQLTVRDGRIDGYVKPLFSDMDVYDREQDANESVLRQAYEGLVGGVASLLENPRRDQVATVTDLSGRVENPRASTIDIVVGLIRNAFVKAILPGLEPERG